MREARVVIDKMVPTRSNPSIMSDWKYKVGKGLGAASLEIQFTHLTPLGNYDVHFLFPPVVTRARSGNSVLFGWTCWTFGLGSQRGAWKVALARQEFYQIEQKSPIDKDK